MASRFARRPEGLPPLFQPVDELPAAAALLVLVLEPHLVPMLAVVAVAEILVVAVIAVAEIMAVAVAAVAEI